MGIQKPTDGLGYLQVVNDVTSLRVVGTTYYNTTGKPIYISCYGDFASTNHSARLTIDGTVVYQTQGYAAGADASFVGIVKPGGSYSINNVVGTFTPTVWTELK